MKMRNLIKHRVFISTFLFVYVSFFFSTIYVFEIKNAGIGVGNWEYGFPFIYYNSHCFGGSYIYEGLIGNILFAIILSFLLGLISSYVLQNLLLQFYSKLTSKEFLNKWLKFRQKRYL